MNGGDITVQAGNAGGVPQEVVQRACGICQSPTHVDANCPTAKSREMQQRMNERGASLKVARHNMSDDEECDDVEFVEDTDGESEGGMELGSVTITREEMNEFLQSNNAGN